LTIGIDLGGTFLRAGLVDGLRVVEEKRLRADLSTRCARAKPEDTEKIVVDTLHEIIDGIRKQNPVEVDAVGLSVPGFVDGKTGVLYSSPNLPGLKNTAIATSLSVRLGIPVCMENDALNAAWGEYLLLPEQPDNLIYVGLGTGIGGGLIVDRNPFRGANGTAMEIGHLIVERDGRPCGCGNRGCVEKYASATGVSLSFEQRTRQRIDCAEIAQLASDGNNDAIESFALAGRMLGQALAQIIKILDVTEIIIGGGVSAAWQWLEHECRKQLDTELYEPLGSFLRIRTSQCRDQAGILGAADLARNHFGNSTMAS